MNQIAKILDKVHCCDCLEFMRQMPAESVHCVVTSPPYWGLRDYGVEGQLGLEKTPEEYIAKMVEVFREVRRILRKDGTLWLNMGDSYCGGGRGFGYGGKQDTNKGCDGMPKSTVPPGLKEKDLCMMPHRLALALQKDGWWIRSDIVWHKPNPMPESCTDRPTKSHEYIFLCTKSAKYYYDADAIRGKSVDPESFSGRRERNAGTMDNTDPDNYKFHGSIGDDGKLRSGQTYPKRNKRSVWTIPTQAYSEAHFATFPEKLVEPCIKAGTSEKGCCPECGAPWARVVEKDRKPTRAGHTQKTEDYNYDTQRHVTETKTIGWQPGCSCSKTAVPVPCLVYDLFFGAGTVGLVAYKLNRHWLGTELNPEYVKIAEKRIKAEQDKFGLFNEK